MSTLLTRRGHGEEHGPVAEYAGALAARLRGPAGLRRSMITEARDGLEDAAEHLTSTGVSRADAERLAVAEFGPVREVAAAFQQELAVVHARRGGLFVLAAFPALLVAWDLLWQGMGAGLAAPRLVVLLAGLTDWVSFAMSATGAATVLALTRWGRRLVSPQRVVALFGVLVLVGLVCLAGFSWTMIAVNAGETQQAVFSLLGIAVNAVSCAGVVWASYGAVRSLRLSRRIAALRHR